jgi:hypothetical protein
MRTTTIISIVVAINGSTIAPPALVGVNAAAAQSASEAPSVDPALRSLLATTTTAPVRGIVDLARIPSAEDRSALAASGIRLGKFLGGYSYQATFTREANLGNTGLVRAARAVRPEDKLESDLHAGRIPDWARTPDGRIRLLVMFHEDVPLAAAREVIGRHAPSHSYDKLSNTWAVEVDEKRLAAIAAEPAVRRVEPGPHPAKLLRN